MAGKACHGFGSTTQVGLTQALGLMNLAALVLLSFIAALWLRTRYLRFVSATRAAEDEREKRMLHTLSNSADFVGHPARLLFEAMGTETSSCSGDFGLVSYCWRANDLCIYADVKNGICETIERHGRGI